MSNILFNSLIVELVAAELERSYLLRKSKTKSK